MTNSQRDALYTLAYVLRICEEHGIRLEHDLDHMRLEIKGFEPLEAGYIGPKQIKEYLDKREEQ